MTDTPNYDDYYYYEDDVYKKIYNVSTRVNIYLQMFTVIINIFHICILSQKELRSIAIYIIMIGICISDIINFFLDFYNAAIEIMWIPNLFPNSPEMCLRDDYVEVNPPTQAIYTLLDISRRVSVWLAIAMALIRTLSVMFPMSTRIQNMAKPKAAVYTVLGMVLFWTVYSSWQFVTFRILWLPDNLNKMCKIRAPYPIAPRHVFASPTWLPYLLNDLGFIEGILKILPAVLYPILTVLLLNELRTIRKRRENMKKNEGGKSSSTTKLILFMTVTFMLSEGLAGVHALFMYNLEKLLKWDEDFGNALITAYYPIINLKTINAASHAIVCFLMSSQYRDVVKSLFCESAMCKRKTAVLKVEQTRSTSFNSVGKSMSSS